MNLAHGGHLSHGSPVNISGKYFNIVPYGVDKETGVQGTGWSRQYLLSYNNGTAIVGKAPAADQKGKFIGVEVIENVRGLGDDHLDVNGLKSLIAKAKKLNEKEYTVDSWENLEACLESAENALTHESLKYTFEKDFNEVKDSLKEAIENLEKLDDSSSVDKPSTPDDKPDTNKPAVPDNDNTDVNKPDDENIDSDVLGEEVDTTHKPNQNLTTPSGNKNNHVQTGDSTTIVPYAILTTCTVLAYMTIRKRKHV